MQLSDRFPIAWVVVIALTYRRAPTRIGCRLYVVAGALAAAVPVPADAAIFVGGLLAQIKEEIDTSQNTPEPKEESFTKGKGRKSISLLRASAPSVDGYVTRYKTYPASSIPGYGPTCEEKGSIQYGELDGKTGRTIFEIR